jgi:mono/diheme cytochrome c family protein
MMRGTALSGWALLVVALLAAIVIVVGLYAWDSSARAAEAALRPAPVAPLAPVAQTPNLPIVSASPAASPQASASAPVGNDDAAAGQAVFARTCNSCHPNANAGIGPALYGPAFAARYPDDAAIAAVIRQGKGGMPAFSAAQLSDGDLANVIAYLRGLSSGAVAPEPTPTPRPRQRSG